MDNKKSFRIYRSSIVNCSLFVALWLFFLALPIAAQTISGTVTDQNNAPIANAKITVLDREKLFLETFTDAEGKFSFDLQNKYGLQKPCRA